MKGAKQSGPERMDGKAPRIRDFKVHWERLKMRSFRSWHSSPGGRNEAPEGLWALHVSQFSDRKRNLMFCNCTGKAHMKMWRSLITPNPPTNIVDFGGFDSSIILFLRGGIPRPIGDFPDNLSQAMLVECNVSREIGRTPDLPSPASRPGFFARARILQPSPGTSYYS